MVGKVAESGQAIQRSNLCSGISAELIPSFAGENNTGTTAENPLHNYGYRDCLAKRSVDEVLAGVLAEKLLTTKCPGYWIEGSTDAGERFYMELHCGREWCPVCGARWSDCHKRKFARLLERARQMDGIGYFVIEYPLRSRPAMHNKKALARAGKISRRVIKDAGYARGLSRWHFFGESGAKYNPHLNVLVDGAYLAPAKLESVKARLRSALGEPQLIVNYSFRKSPAEMVHTLKYITRATFLDATWDIPLALELRGFRNVAWWGSGKWAAEPVWACDAAGIEGMAGVEKLVQGVSPNTGLPITWASKVLPISALRHERIRKVWGAGYGELEPVPLPPDLPADTRTRLYWLEALHRVKVRLAEERAQQRADAESEYQAIFWREVSE